MAFMAVVARRCRLACCQGPAVHALLVELVRLRYRDVPALDQGSVGVAAAACLGRSCVEGWRFGIQVAAQAMGLAMAIEAERGVLDAPGQRLGMHASEVRL